MLGAAFAGAYNAGFLSFLRRDSTMAMKKTDLEKNKALKLNNKMNLASADRFGKTAQPVADRREQRKLDQAKGLVPFACKLDRELVAQLNTLAAAHPEGMTGLLTEVVQRGLAQAS